MSTEDRHSKEKLRPNMMIWKLLPFVVFKAGESVQCEIKKH